MKKSLAPYVYKWLKPSTKIGSGGVIPKSAALGRLMRWPKYVRLQRQRKILLQRLKIPPALNIFNRGCSKEFAHRIVRFCKNYSPESRKQKTLRLRAQAKLMAEGKALPKEGHSVRDLQIQSPFGHSGPPQDRYLSVDCRGEAGGSEVPRCHHPQSEASV